MKKHKKEIIILSITSILFIILSLLVATKTTLTIDTKFHIFILNIRNNNLNIIFEYLTNLASATLLLAISIILLITMKNKKHSLYILLNLVLAFFSNELAKSIFNRSRPIGINLIDETGLSYPSGHSMVGLCFYGFITYLLYKNTKKKSHKIILMFTLILITLTIGFSRIYLGVHYLTDVIGGFLLAIIHLTLYIKLITKEKK